MPRTIRSPKALFVRWWRLFGALMVAMLSLTSQSPAESFREQVEADWARHEECSLAQIRQPGILRFPHGEVTWEGAPGSEPTAAGGSVRVPKLPGPKLDGRLDDPCWRGAVQVPLGPADQPVQPAIRLCLDDQFLYVGATFPSAAEACFHPASTASDASGAVDGVKNGRYGFHTNMEPNPWWQVDLGARQPIGKIVIYNRLDYAPGLHNADYLVILSSDDGKVWRLTM